MENQAGRDRQLLGPGDGIGQTRNLSALSGVINSYHSRRRKRGGQPRSATPPHLSFFGLATPRRVPPSRGLFVCVRLSVTFGPATQARSASEGLGCRHFERHRTLRGGPSCHYRPSFDSSAPPRPSLHHSSDNCPRRTDRPTSF